MLGIVGALEAEIDSIKSELKNSREVTNGPFTYYLGLLDGRDVALIQCGVGKVLAAMTTQFLIDTVRPSHIIFTGVAGALNPDLEIGDLVIGRTTIQHDVEAMALGFLRGEVPYTGLREVRSSPILCSIAERFVPSGGAKVLSGVILSGDQFITQSELLTHRYLIDELNGDAVEMEGASLAFVCARNNVEFLILRTISDKANDAAHTDFSAFLPRASKQSLEILRFLLKNFEY